MLLGQVAPDISSRDLQRMEAIKDQGITRRMDLAAAILAGHLGDDVTQSLMKHSSDTV